MKSNFITPESPQALIDAYRNNVTFCAIVKKHEFAGSDYQTMMEDAVVVMSGDLERVHQRLMRYCEIYGVLND
jgi:hypothetical protein